MEGTRHCYSDASTDEHDQDCCGEPTRLATSNTETEKGDRFYGEEWNAYLLPFRMRVVGLMRVMRYNCSDSR